MLTLLRKIPFAGTALSWVGSNVRLAIEYALIAVLMVVGGTAITLWFKTKDLEDTTRNLQTTLTQEILINQAQTATIETYADLRTRDAKSLETILLNYSILNEKSKTNREKMKALEQNDATVKELLGRPVPPSLNCVLSPETCDPARKDSDQGGHPASSR